MRYKKILNYTEALFKWLTLSLLVGVSGGVIGSIFHLSIDFVTDFRAHNPTVIYFLPLGGLIIALLYSLFKNQGAIDTDRVLKAASSGEKVPVVMLPLIFISTLITHFLGGSAGREGAALQLGGSIGYNIGRLLRLNNSSTQIIVISGMSAVFAALFGTPTAAAVFAVEVALIGSFRYAAFLPSVVSAYTAYKVSKIFGISAIAFSVGGFNAPSLELLIKAVILAVLCGLLSILFCQSIHYAEHFAKKLLPNTYIKAAVGGAVLILLTLIVGTYQYNGAGMDVVALAMSGKARPEAFILKLVFTAVTIAAGFKGGEIVPAFFIGSTFGCFAGTLLGIDPAIGSAIGFVALFCGAVNCPLASVFLAVEVFGGDSLILMAIVCAVSFIVSGKFSLYKSQKFIYSKINTDKEII